MKTGFADILLKNREYTSYYQIELFWISVSVAYYSFLLTTQLLFQCGENYVQENSERRHRLGKKTEAGKGF